MKSVEWEGDSRDVLRSFPESIRRDLGTGLMYVQCGAIPADAKSLKTGMPGTWELRAKDASAMKKSRSKRDNINVFDELGFPPEESRVLGLKAQLAALIVRIVHERSLTQKQLGTLWGVPQPRVSEVMTGKLAVTSINRLVEFLGALGVEVIVSAKPVRGARRKTG